MHDFARLVRLHCIQYMTGIQLQRVSCFIKRVIIISVKYIKDKWLICEKSQVSCQRTESKVIGCNDLKLER